jgi:hypothetical protein
MYYFKTFQSLKLIMDYIISNDQRKKIQGDFLGIKV